MYDNYAGSLQKQTAKCYELRAPSVSENINQQLQHAVNNVKRLTELKGLIERNPDIERILTLMNR